MAHSKILGHQWSHEPSSGCWSHAIHLFVLTWFAPGVLQSICPCEEGHAVEIELTSWGISRYRRVDDCPCSGDHRSCGRCRPPLVDSLSLGALRVAALGCGRPYRCLRAWPGRVLAGLIVGLPVLALPGVRGSRPSSDVPSIVEYPVMPPPPILAFGWGESAGLEPPRGAPGRDGASGVSTPGPPVRDDVDGADDDASSLPGPMRGGRSLPRPSPRVGVTGMTSAVPWPFPYLARPQLLTRP